MGRQEIAQEIEKRLWAITTADGYSVTMASVLRNPGTVPSVFPQVNIFEGEDLVEEKILGNVIGGGVQGPYIRKWVMTIEFWKELVAEEEDGSSDDAIKMANGVKYALFNDGSTLGGLCDEIVEVGLSPVIRPPIGRRAVGMGLDVEITYTDDRNYTKQ